MSLAGRGNPVAPWVVNALVVVLCLTWSSTWWGIRITLEELPPLTAAGVRFLLAGIVMVAVTARWRRREEGKSPPVWLWVTMGVANFAAPYGVLYWAETSVPSGIAAVLWSIFPVLMAIAGHTMLGETLRFSQMCGFGVAFLGVVAMFAGDLGGAGVQQGHALVLLLSPLAAAIGTTLVKRHGPACSSLELNRNGMLLGAALLCASGLLFEDPDPSAVGVRAIVATVYLALIGTCLSFGLYFWLLRWAQANRMSLIAYATAPLALLFGWLVGDGEIDAATVVSTTAIVAGIVLVLRQTPPSAPKANGTAPTA